MYRGRNGKCNPAPVQHLCPEASTQEECPSLSPTLALCTAYPVLDSENKKATFIWKLRHRCRLCHHQDRGLG